MLASLALIATILPTQQAEIKPHPLSDFIGRSFDQIKFEKTTDEDLKKLYKTAKSKLRPEALELPTSEAQQIHALLDGRGKDAVCNAVLWVPTEYRKLDDLKRHIEIAPEVAYPRTRYEDFAFAFWSTRGIMAIYNPTEGDLFALVLSTPERVAETMDSYPKEATAISTIVDPGANWNRVLNFSRYYVDVNINSSNRPGELGGSYQRNLEGDLEGIVRRMGGAVRYDRSTSGGRFDIKVSSTKFNDKFRATFTVDMDFETQTPYGSLRASSYRTKGIENSYSRELNDLIDDAFDALFDDIGDKLKRLRPETKGEKTQETIQSMLTQLTRKKA
ncbi:MAG: hypothetical protein KDC26_12320 [Armatimonadetes bacterium]|nr:hypothetical protein [Armatimonadota bacterium]